MLKAHGLIIPAYTVLRQSQVLKDHGLQQTISGVNGPWTTIPAYMVLRQSQVLKAHRLQFQHIRTQTISGVNGPRATIPAYTVLRQSQVLMARVARFEDRAQGLDESEAVPDAVEYDNECILSIRVLGVLFAYGTELGSLESEVEHTFIPVLQCARTAGDSLLV